MPILHCNRESLLDLYYCAIYGSSGGSDDRIRIGLIKYVQQYRNNSNRTFKRFYAKLFVLVYR